MNTKGAKPKKPLTQKEKDNVKELAQRLCNTLLTDYQLTISDIVTGTGFSRETIRQYLIEKERQINFRFILSCFDFLKEKTPDINLNIQYFLDQKCSKKYMSYVNEFESLGISHKVIENIESIGNFPYEGAVGHPYLNTLNLLLTNPKLVTFIYEITKSIDGNGKSLSDFQKWQQEKCVREYMDSFLTDLNHPLSSPSDWSYEKPNRTDE